MRKSVIPVFICFLFAATIYSQGKPDTIRYQEGLVLLNKAKTTEGYLEAAFYFDSMTGEFPDQWLVPYYIGLSYILAGQHATVNKYRDQLLDRAQRYVDRSYTLKPDAAENHILQAFLYQIRLMVDPQSRAIAYSQKADASLKKAITSDPSNPRAYFLMGNNIYYTPAIFKGGPKNALAVFLKAREKYDAYTLQSPIMPNWGRQQNEEMIKNCRDAKN
jgi:hypothetical protein